MMALCKELIPPSCQTYPHTVVVPVGFVWATEWVILFEGSV